MRALLLLLPLFAIPSCVTVNTQTVRGMSNEQLCDMLGPAWFSTAREKSAMNGEINRRGVSCFNGQVASYQPRPAPTPAPRPAPTPQTRPQTPSQATGSCFAVNPRQVVTSHHVVAGANRITVRFQSGSEMSARVAKQSQSNDLAVLDIQGAAPAHLSLAQPRSLKVGQEIFTIGYPASAVLGNEPKFTEGY